MGNCSYIKENCGGQPPDAQAEVDQKKIQIITSDFNPVTEDNGIGIMQTEISEQEYENQTNLTNEDLKILFTQEEKKNKKTLISQIEYLAQQILQKDKSHKNEFMTAIEMYIQHTLLTNEIHQISKSNPLYAQYKYLVEGLLKQYQMQMINEKQTEIYYKKIQTILSQMNKFQDSESDIEGYNQKLEKSKNAKVLLQQFQTKLGVIVVEDKQKKQFVNIQKNEYFYFEMLLDINQNSEIVQIIEDRSGYDLKNLTFYQEFQNQKENALECQDQFLKIMKIQEKHENNIQIQQIHLQDSLCNLQQFYEQLVLRGKQMNINNITYFFKTAAKIVIDLNKYKTYGLLLIPENFVLVQNQHNQQFEIKVKLLFGQNQSNLAVAHFNPLYSFSPQFSTTKLQNGVETPVIEKAEDKLKLQIFQITRIVIQFMIFNYEDTAYSKFLTQKPTVEQLTDLMQDFKLKFYHRYFNKNVAEKDQYFQHFYNFLLNNIIPNTYEINELVEFVASIQTIEFQNQYEIIGQIHSEKLSKVFKNHSFIDNIEDFLNNNNFFVCNTPVEKYNIEQDLQTLEKCILNFALDFQDNESNICLIEGDYAVGKSFALKYIYNNINAIAEKFQNNNSENKNEKQSKKEIIAIQLKPYIYNSNFQALVKNINNLYKIHQQQDNNSNNQKILLILIDDIQQTKFENQNIVQELLFLQNRDNRIKVIFTLTYKSMTNLEIIEKFSFKKKFEQGFVKIISPVHVYLTGIKDEDIEKINQAKLTKVQNFKNKNYLSFNTYDNLSDYFSQIYSNKKLSDLMHSPFYSNLLFIDQLSIKYLQDISRCQLISNFIFNCFKYQISKEIRFNENLKQNCLDLYKNIQFDYNYISEYALKQIYKDTFNFGIEIAWKLSDSNITHFNESFVKQFCESRNIPFKLGQIFLQTHPLIIINNKTNQNKNSNKNNNQLNNIQLNNFLNIDKKQEYQQLLEENLHQNQSDQKNEILYEFYCKDVYYFYIIKGIEHDIKQMNSFISQCQDIQQFYDGVLEFCDLTITNDKDKQQNQNNNNASQKNNLSPRLITNKRLHFCQRLMTDQRRLLFLFNEHFQLYDPRNFACFYKIIYSTKRLLQEEIKKNNGKILYKQQHQLSNSQQLQQQKQQQQQQQQQLPKTAKDYLKIASSNSFTFLNAINMPLIQQNFSNTSLQGCLLSNAYLELTLFDNADLQNSEMLQAYLGESSLENSNLNNIQVNFISNFQDEEDRITCMDFSQDSSKIITGNAKGSINKFSVISGERLNKVGNHKRHINVVKFSPNDKLIGSCAFDHSIKIWEEEKHSLLFTFNHTDDIKSIDFSYDSKLLASAGLDKNIIIWDLEKGEQKQSFSENQYSISFLCFSTDDQKICFATYDGGIKLWDFRIQQQQQQKKNIKRVGDHRDIVNTMVFNYNSTMLLSGSGDKLIKLWDVNKSELIYQFKNCLDHVFKVQFNLNEQSFFSCSKDNVLRTWNLLDKKVSNEIYLDKSEVSSVTISKNNLYYAFANYDRSFKIFKFHNHQKFKKSQGHLKHIYCVQFNYEGTKFASSSGDRTIRVWCAKSFVQLQKIKYNSQYIAKQIQFHPNEQLLGIAAQNELLIWDLEKNQQHNLLKTQVNCFQFSPNGKKIAIGQIKEEDTDYLNNSQAQKSVIFRNLLIQSLEDSLEVSSLDGHKDSVWCVNFNHSGTKLASGAGVLDQTIRVWSVRMESQERVLTGHTDSIYDVQFLPQNQNNLISCSKDRTVRLWGLDDQQVIHIFKSENAGPILNFSLGVLNNYIISCSRTENFAILRSLKTGQIIQKLPATKPTFVTQNHDSSLVLVGLQNGALLVYKNQKKLFDEKSFLKSFDEKVANEVQINSKDESIYEQTESLQNLNKNNNFNKNKINNKKSVQNNEDESGEDDEEESKNSENNNNDNDDKNNLQESIVVEKLGKMFGKTLTLQKNDNEKIQSPLQSPLASSSMDTARAEKMIQDAMKQRFNLFQKILQNDNPINYEIYKVLKKNKDLNVQNAVFSNTYGLSSGQIGIIEHYKGIFD